MNLKEREIIVDKYWSNKSGHPIYRGKVCRFIAVCKLRKNK